MANTGSGSRNGARRGQVVGPEDGVPGGYDPEVDSGYNPADFVLPATDHQGHTERVYCRVQPQHARALSVIYRSRKFPFRTEGDLFRWALVRALKVLDRLDPTPGFMGVADAITEIMRQQLYMQEFTDMFATMETIISKHVAAGSNGEARKMLAVVLQKIRTIEGEDHWRAKCEGEVLRRFGHLLEGKVRSKLVQAVGDTDGEG